MPRTSQLALVGAGAITVGTVGWIGGASMAAWASAAIAAWAWLATCVGLALRRQQRLPTPWLLLPVLGFGVEAWLQWALRLSVYPGSTLSALVQLSTCGAILYLGWMALGDAKQLERLGLGAWILCGLMGGEAIAQFFTAGKWIYWVRDATYADPIGPYVYHNHFAGCMEMLLPVAVAVAWRPGQGWRNARALILPGLGLISLVLAHSRGGIGTLVVETATGMALISWRLHSLRWLRHIWLPAGAMAAVALLVNWHPLIARFTQLRYGDPAAIYRWAAAKTCWRMFLASPSWGSGLGTFATVFPKFRTFDDGLTWPYAHNDWLQMLAEMGVVGGVCVAGFIGLAATEVWRVLHAPANLANRIQLAAAVSMLALLVHSVIDFQFHSPANAELFFLLTAAVTVGPLRRARRRTRTDPDLRASRIERTEAHSI